MNIILSRKGFDSANGGHPSPILPDGTLLSLPIPSEDTISYSELTHSWPDGSTISYESIMRMLYPSILYKKRRYSISEKHCHLDPDLQVTTYPRFQGWRGAFGQIGASQSHLRNEGIGKNDLFLFFGWFKATEWKDNVLKFRRDSQDIHVLFGYLEVGDIYVKGAIPSWLQYHPHVSSDRLKDKSNCIYLGREKSRLGGYPGYGTFRFDEELILTKSGESRSRWNLPEIFRGLKITHHSDDSWKERYFQSVPIGQEFVVEENPDVTEWAKSLILRHLI